MQIGGGGSFKPKGPFCWEELPEKFYGDMSINIGNSRALHFLLACYLLQHYKKLKNQFDHFESF